MRFQLPRTFSFLSPSLVIKSATSCFLLSCWLVSCKITTPIITAPPDPIILKVGNKVFTTDEFFKSFTRNQISTDSSKLTDIREYVDLYMKLKLKVRAAEQEGRDTTEGFREELATYRKQLSQSYLQDKVLVEHLVAESYERLTQEVNLSHILIAVQEDATPADTAHAYQSALDVRKRLLAGEDFTQVARQISNDPTVTDNGGNLGYITAFQVIYPLETAAYMTSVGSLSMPVRTRSGYHLIKVLDRRPSRGKVRVAHILVRVNPTATFKNSDESGKAKARIDEVYERLQKGEPFEALVREFSDDRESRNAGGVLPIFSTGQNVLPFEEEAFRLNEPGSYSQPFQTTYGWHIVRLLEKIPLDSFETMAPILRQKVMTDTRGELIRTSLIQRLRQAYSVTESTAILTKTLSLADSSLLIGKWKIPSPIDPAIDKKPIVFIDQQPYETNQFLEYVYQHQQPRPAGSAPIITMSRLFHRFMEDKLIEREEANLEKKHPDFRVLMNDIRDGILLSQMMESNVWEKSLADSVGQRAYFDQHRNNYRYDQRAAASVLIAANENVLKQATEILAKSPYQLRQSVKELTYAPNQTELTTKHREDLFNLLVILIKNPDYLVEVSGSAETNEADTISAARIQKVISFLTANRIPILRIMERDHGKFRPGSKGNESRRVTFQLFSTSKKDVEKVLNGLSAGQMPSERMPSRPDRTQQQGSIITITDGLFTKGANPYVDATEWAPGTKTITLNGKIARVVIERIEAPRLKSFEEARGAVINDYQTLLEQQWIERLKRQFPVQINEDEMRKLVK